jgi:hypothetical protein
MGTAAIKLRRVSMRALCHEARVAGNAILRRETTDPPPAQSDGHDHRYAHQNRTDKASEPNWCSPPF